MSEAAFPVTLTPEALQRVRNLVERSGKSEGFLRVGVKGGGCSGFEYVLRVEDVPRDNDLVNEVDGVVVRCDPKSASFLQGSVIEWTGNLMQGGLAIQNPNAARSCGCGTSFTPKSPAPGAQ